MISIGVAFIYQYGIARILTKDDGLISKIPTVGQYLVDSWNDGCTDYDDDLREKCVGNAGALRAAACATLFFLGAALAAMVKPTINDEKWSAKYTLFQFMVLGSIFIPNKPFFSDIYIWIGRIGGMVFIFLQQIILIDLAYSWNDAWISKSNAAEVDERGSGKKWLIAILASCLTLFVGSITVIVMLFIYFSGCQENVIFLYLTIVISVLVTIFQLCSEEASLLTSAVITSYATYLVLTAITKNPNGECNPKLGDDDELGKILGIGITIISLAWTGWSFTADEKLVHGSKRSSLVEMSFPLVDDQTSRGNNHDLDEYAMEVESFDNDTDEDINTSLRSWRLNIVLALISCWYGMALTGWGSVEIGGNGANPQVSNASMWMIISSQWSVMALYLWTIIAPKIFPDRDFS